MSYADIFHPPLPQKDGAAIYWSHLLGDSIGLALSDAIWHAEHPFLIVTPDYTTLTRLIEACQFFGNPTLLHFPGWETLPYDHFSSHPDITSDRITALNSMPTLKKGAMITTIDTLMHRLPPCHFLHANSLMIKVGDILDRDSFTAKLTAAGYIALKQVREHGEFAVRGSIIDLFPMGSPHPFRIDLLDNEIDTLRIFSPETQRTTEAIAEIRLLPAKEFPFTSTAIESFRQNWRNRFGGNPLSCPLYQDMSEGRYAPGIEYYFPLFFQETATLFDYLPNNTTIVYVEGVKQKAAQFWQEIQSRYEAGRHNLSKPLLLPDQLFLMPDWIAMTAKNYPRLIVSAGELEMPKKATVVKFPVREAHLISERELISAFPSPQEGGIGWGDQNPQPSNVIADLSPHPIPPSCGEGNALSESAAIPARTLFCTESLGRQEAVLQLLHARHITPTSFDSWQAFLNSKEPYGITLALLEQGFIIETPAIAVITENELYEKRIMQRRLRKKSTQNPENLIRDLIELQLNDPVVHLEHGVGRYQGLKTLTVGEEQAEYVCLSYQDDDKLFVPISSLHLINRYTGADREHAPLNKLGNEQWQKTKRRAIENVSDTAAELLDIYAKRAAHAGHTYHIPADEYANFVAQFPFEETPDQLQAIEHVMQDMSSVRTMDRVVCGDVGFGKTEVAMRAAFIAVLNHKQVAILAPTTLLAQQHLQNFQDRFAKFPIHIDMISRFRTHKEQTTILKKLEEGKIDIIIGTHQLLQDRTKFKTLGLVIIDEEHRFGVKQKEKIKAWHHEIDILALTATPIPRTLNMALSGIRDLSIIATPPLRRLSVKTFIHEYQDDIIREAIERELLRGGQVYFLHNDIATIHKEADLIKNLVKAARVNVAHGQMHERELEKIMSDFYHRRTNVLVCSTIIESGIDIPTANTIIINRADRLGIAQLHQLRGRVGRSHHQAYAYLFVPNQKHMTRDAIERLAAIAAYNDLGIGFTLSTHDLEIRGAGELLGENQSGNMREVGFTLYMDLLTRAIEAIKSGQDPTLQTSLFAHSAEINLHLTALIPEDYLFDIQLRLHFYKRLANCKTHAELEDIQVEMIDRFGLLPTPLKNLFAISELKIKTTTMGITKLEASENGGKIEFGEKPNIKPEALIKLLKNEPHRFQMQGPTRLRFTLDSHKLKERVGLVEKLLGMIT
ncbi:MAG: transcription-repair coupling factor [Gammaproteobacteria bacterium RIFCSPHIGHO2_12_FULL_42_10]|nr:MAG: transcription-repair coupling factor [Gammaproteobacteria bacterium RIFCSPHIGHO2_12_FULL_42_10]